MDNTQINTKAEIIAALQERYQELLAWFNQQDDPSFSAELVPGKWSMGQHADHLVKSTAPLNQALRMPAISLSAMFGKKNDRAARSYPELVDKYHSKLSGGGAASGRYLPDAVTSDQKEKIMTRLEKEVNNLESIIEKWDEKKLDVYLLPHPLLGKLTIREMLFFTIYHTEHHYRLLAENYTA